MAKPPTRAKTARTTRRYKGQSTEELRLERRQRLLTAAYVLVGSEGYSKVSIEQVCSRAKVATRHYYEHFQGREPLLHALFDQIAAEMLEVVTQALTEYSPSTTERALHALCAFVRFALTDPKRARIACLESVGVSMAMEKKRRGLIRQFARLIAGTAQQLVKEGTLPPGDYQMSGIALVGAINELLVEWLSGDTALSIAQMEAQITAILRALIRGTKSTQKKPAVTKRSPR